MHWLTPFVKYSVAAAFARCVLFVRELSQLCHTLECPSENLDELLRQLAPDERSITFFKCDVINMPEVQDLFYRSGNIRPWCVWSYWLKQVLNQANCSPGDFNPSVQKPLLEPSGQTLRAYLQPLLGFSLFLDALPGERFTFSLLSIASTLWWLNVGGCARFISFLFFLF